ncbi:MAG: GNAT family N-acetyltransferase [Acidimicrobiia bacterium]|nr:GNAT family N-acetyltransferase [Acidimicrobiia bacterium]
MGFPQGLTSRGARPDDARRVFELIEAVDLVDIGEKMVDLSDIESDWATPERRIADDVLLVELDGELVAWAQVNRDRADADVHPDHRGRGVGLALIEWTERVAAENANHVDGVCIGQTIIEDLPGTLELFVARGYEKGWDSWVLHLPPDTTMNTPDLGDAFIIRAADPDDDRAVYQVVEDAFNGWEGRTPRTFEQWRSGTIERTDFDRSLLLVAEVHDPTDPRNGEIVGVCFGVHYPDEGWADQIAVAHSHRGRGVARVMLAELFDEFRSRGQHRLGLNTDSRTGALGLYLDLGMVVTETFTRWSRVL